MRKLPILGLILLACAVLLQACGAQVERHLYLRVQPSEGLVIDQLGSRDLAGLYGAGEIPLAYKITRDSYRLAIRIPDDSYLPTLELRLSPATLGLVPRPDSALESPRGITCGSYYPGEEGSNTLTFGWSPDCTSPTMPRILAVDIVDQQGDVIGSERLALSLLPDGWYYLPDAL